MGLVCNPDTTTTNEIRATHVPLYGNFGYAHSPTVLRKSVSGVIAPTVAPVVTNTLPIGYAHPGGIYHGGNPYLTRTVTKLVDAPAQKKLCLGQSSLLPQRTRIAVQ